MSAPSSFPGSCDCGQVIFDLSGRTVGEVLTCSWCGSRFQYGGGDKLEPLPGNQPPRVFPAAAKTEKPAARPATPGARRNVNRNPGPPGGMMPMIAFMIAFNVLAIVSVSFAFPKNPADDLRHAVWDDSFVLAKKSIWPEIAALVIGNMLGFGAWAIFAYGIHKKEQAERAAKT